MCPSFVKMEGESFGDFEIELESEISDEFVVILVFGRKYPVPISEQTLKIAWKIFVLPSNGKVNFMFPHKSKVGAFYFNGESQVTAGPLDAKIGSTWVAMSSADQGSLVLTESENSKFCFENYVSTIINIILKFKVKVIFILVMWYVIKSH